MIGICSITLALVLLLGLSYAWLTTTLKGEKKNVIKSGTLSLTLDESSTNGILLENAVPTSDMVGMKGNAYTFTLENKGTIDSTYRIWLKDDELETGETRLPNARIKYELVIDGVSTGARSMKSITETQMGSPTVEPVAEPGAGSPTTDFSDAAVTRILDLGTIGSGEKKTYTLRIWIDINGGSEVMGKVFRASLVVDGSQKSEGVNAVETILGKANTDDVTSYESGKKGELFAFHHTAGTQQAGWSEGELTDYRYIGSNPNNYVIFNNESWRILGVFTVENESGEKTQNLKIVRDSIVSAHPYDNGVYKEGSTDPITGIITNDWSQSKLMKLLNPGYEALSSGGSLYWNRLNGICYRENNSTVTSPCDFETNGLRSISQQKIASVKWYLGGVSSLGADPISTVSAEALYQQERGTNVYNAGVESATNWIGKVGLLYPSDYVFTTKNTTTGEGEILYDWLNLSGEFFITPSSEGNATSLIRSSDSSQILATSSASSMQFRPVVYLNSDVEITSGTGSVSQPYVLGD